MSAFTVVLSWKSLGRKGFPLPVNRKESGGFQLPDPELQKQALMVREQIETHRLYLEPELSLDDLARAVGLSRHQVSTVLNRGLNVSFFDLINTYRVEEFQRLCHDSRYIGEKILTIALEAGFNSKPTFNLIFKRMTGQTPSQFRKSIRIESRSNT